MRYKLVSHYIFGIAYMLAKNYGKSEQSFMRTL